MSASARQTPEHGAPEPPVLDLGETRFSIHDRVAEIVIDRETKLNALTPKMLEELERALIQVSVSDASVLVVRAAGAKVFCVGADINEFADLAPQQMWREWTVRGHRVFDTLSELPQPSIAVLHGDAFGGGLELALACDFRIITTDTRLGLPEVGIGTVPGWGGTERLTELVGRARAKEIVLARRRLNADTALAWGVVTEAAPADALDEAVDALVSQLLEGAPFAVQLAKQLIDTSADGAPSRVLESLAGALTASTADLDEGVAAFRERRAPNFTTG
jgi:enoyl-CoA hydratase